MQISGLKRATEGTLLYFLHCSLVQFYLSKNMAISYLPYNLDNSVYWIIHFLSQPKYNDLELFF